MKKYDLQLIMCRTEEYYIRIETFGGMKAIP